jgi:hypothetical protein
MIRVNELSEARYERKFMVAGTEAAQLDHLVRMNPAHFHPIHNPRWINNIYFDSVDLCAFSDTIEGVRDRVKTRIRWYGDSIETIMGPVLELKRKRGFLTIKSGFVLNSAESGTPRSARAVRKLLRDSDLPNELREYVIPSRAVLFNRYMRSYSVSHCGQYRITVDRHLEFQRVFEGFSSGPMTRIGNLVLEIKYGVDADRNVQAVTQHLPFRLSKSSKYAMGVQLTAP